ncbi:MAG: H(+)/Cl(-) exchange transporter ClcA [Deltaproteobacteria bacterium]|nr:H(+)/Cl(-) exchange transporter ClcA [Deltaproteobacteria bacterium]
MNREPESIAEIATGYAGLLVLTLLAFLVGATAGLLGVAFRLALEWAERFRDSVLAWAHGKNLLGFLCVMVLSAAATAVAAWLVRRFSPQATGSGIPHVEAVAKGELPPAPFRLIPVKFLGGRLAIGAGLALGREGPTVQMGATLAHLLGTAFRRTEDDCRVLLAAGAGAGLATAFNAPIAGAVFVLEELVRRFDTRTTIATLGASAGAIAVARVFLSQGPDFRVALSPYPGFGTVVVHLVLGVVIGFLGIAYNRTILGVLTVAERLDRWPVELRAALVGTAVGVLAWFAPSLVGGGDALTQRTLAGTETLVILALVFPLRFGLGAVSYAAETPGGLFAPMLVLGAQTGFVFGIFCNHWLASVAPQPSELAVVGMAAFFTAVVRAPLTGIVMVIEMTASFTLLLPMLAACCAAMVVPTLLGDPPIYDSLSQRSSGDRKRVHSI